jgi:hypothetical protein
MLPNHTTEQSHHAAVTPASDRKLLVKPGRHNHSSVFPEFAISAMTYACKCLALSPVSLLLNSYPNSSLQLNLIRT